MVAMLFHGLYPDNVKIRLILPYIVDILNCAITCVLRDGEVGGSPGVAGDEVARWRHPIGLSRDIRTPEECSQTLSPESIQTPKKGEGFAHKTLAAAKMVWFASRKNADAGVP